MKKMMKKAGLALGAVTGTALALPKVALAEDMTIGKVFSAPEGVANLSYDALVPTVINLIFIVAAGLVFFYLIFGAISWITSGGDKGKVEAARSKITAAVIGVLILAATWAIFQLLMNLLFAQGIEHEIPSLFNS